MTTTPFMKLTLPVPETTLGPEWAQELIAALEKIDSHDHSTDNGTKVTPAGISVNSDLSFASFQATNLKTTQYAAQGATLSTSFVGCLYRVGGNLYFNNGTGTPVQITDGSGIAAVGSGIFTIFVPAAYPLTLTSSEAQKVVTVDSSAARTINLPSATVQMQVVIKDETGSADINNITIVPDGSDTIDGAAANYVLDSALGSINLISDGVSKWLVI